MSKNKPHIEIIVNWRLKHLTLNDEQRKAVLLPKGNIVVSAAAGSGKTYTMTERIMCRVLAGETTLAKLLVLTFTEKASANMQEALQKKINDIAAKLSQLDDNEIAEIGEELYEKAYANLHQAESELNFAQISTIHSFCKQVISNTAYLASEAVCEQASQIKQAQIADENASDVLLEQACQRVLNYVMQINQRRAKFDLSDFGSKLRSIVPDDDAPRSQETPHIVKLTDEFSDLIKQYHLEGENLSAIWQGLLAQLNSRKSLDNMLDALQSAYKQFRTYPFYQRKLQEAAIFADKKAKNIKLSPEYSYLLQELNLAYQRFKPASTYFNTHLPSASFVSQKAKDSERQEVNNYLCSLVTQISEGLEPLLDEYANLPTVKMRFAQTQANKELELDPDDQVYNVYRKIVEFGYNLPNPPNVTAAKGSQAFQFNARVKMSDTDKELKKRYTDLFGPILQLIAPQINIFTKTDVNKFSNIQTKLADFDLGQETYLAEQRAKKTLLWVQLLLAVDITYTELKQAKKLADFADLEQTAFLLLQDENVSRYWRDNFQEIYVDEYQDTSNIQEAILQTLSTNNLFVVGDIKQSIYAFRNAKLENFQHKVELASAAQKADPSAENDIENWQLLNFNTNYRSEANILSFCNLVFQSLFSESLVGFDYINDKHYFQTDKEANTTVQEPEVEIVRVHANETQHESLQIAQELVNKLESSDIGFEVTKLLPNNQNIKTKTVVPYLIANQIKHLMQELRQNQIDKSGAIPTIAILARSHAILAQVAYALQTSHISYTMTSSKNDIIDEENKPTSLAARELYFLIKALANLADDETVSTVLTSSYLEQPLSLAELAEIKAASLDYCTTRLQGEVDSEQKQLLNNMRYLPYNQLIDLYVAASTTDKPTAQLANNITLCRLYESKLPNFLVDYKQYVKVDLARKVAFNLGQIKRWQALFSELGFELAWQTIFSELKLQQHSLAPEATEKQEQALLALRRLVRQTCQQAKYPTLTQLLSYIPTAAKLQLDTTDTEDTVANVQLLTFHAAKGLEFNYVFVAGLDYQLKNRTSSLHYNDELGFIMQDTLSDAFLKYASMSSIAAKINERQKMYAEELRLLYVAMTRAMQKLYLYLDTFDATAVKADNINVLEIYQNSTYSDLLSLAMKLTPREERLRACLCANAQTVKAVYQVIEMGFQSWVNNLAELYLSAPQYQIWHESYLAQLGESTLTTPEESDTKNSKKDTPNEPIENILQGETLLQQAEYLSKQSILTRNVGPAPTPPNAIELTAQQQQIAKEWSTQLSALLKRLSDFPSFTNQEGDESSNFVNNRRLQQDILANPMELTEKERLGLSLNLAQQTEIDITRELSIFNRKYGVSSIKELFKQNELVTNDMTQLPVPVDDLGDNDADLQDAFIEAIDATKTAPLSAAQSAKFVSDFKDLLVFADALTQQQTITPSTSAIANQLTSTMRGTVIHRFLQFVDLRELRKVHNELLSQGVSENNILEAFTQSLAAQLVELQKQEIIPSEAFSAAKKVLPNLSKIYMPIMRMQELANVYREFPFVMQLPLVEFLNYFPELAATGIEDKLNCVSDKVKSDLKITVQGVIDLWWQDKDDIYLVDYKTDYFSPEILGDETTLHEFFNQRYRVQLLLYALALKQGLGLSAENFAKHLHVYIYSVSAGKYVELTLTR